MLLSSLEDGSNEGAPGGSLASLANEASVVDRPQAAAHEDASGTLARSGTSREAESSGRLTSALSAPMLLAMWVKGWVAGILMVLFNKLYSVRP